MTGLPALGPMLPRPSTAVPLETTATRLPLFGVFVDLFLVRVDGPAGFGHTGGIGHGEVFLGLAGLDGNDFELTLALRAMVFECFLFGEQRHWMRPPLEY